MFLSNKTVVITGSCGLIGKVFTETVLENDGNVIVSDINEKDGHIYVSELTKKYGSEKATYFNLDITSKKSITTLLEQHPNIDALVNNAYPRNNNYGKKTEDVTYEDFTENMSMHVGGYFLCMQQFSEHFKKKGRGNIINMSSIYGVVAPRFNIYDGTDFTMPVEYAAIKSSIIHLTKYFSKYYKGYNIRFNCISPGGIFNNHTKTFQANYAKYSNNKGMLDKKDLTGTLLFLLSDLSQYINGQNIIVDDGWSL